MYSSLYSIHSQSLHGEDSSECIESAKQPSPMEKSCRTTLHYIMQMTVHVILPYPPVLSTSFHNILSGSLSIKHEGNTVIQKLPVMA